MVDQRLLIKIRVRILKCAQRVYTGQLSTLFLECEVMGGLAAKGPANGYVEFSPLTRTGSAGSVFESHIRAG